MGCFNPLPWKSARASESGNFFYSYYATVEYELVRNKFQSPLRSTPKRSRVGSRKARGRVSRGNFFIVSGYQSLKVIEDVSFNPLRLAPRSAAERAIEAF